MEQAGYHFNPTVPDEGTLPARKCGILSVLIVSDSVESATDLRHRLTQGGLIVSQVVDLAEAASSLRECNYDLLIIDWGLDPLGSADRFAARELAPRAINFAIASTQPEWAVSLEGRTVWDFMRPDDIYKSIESVWGISHHADRIDRSDE